MSENMVVTDEKLAAHHCLEAVDKVGNDLKTTEFKRRARLHQSLWRESLGLPIGSQPMRPKRGSSSRPHGSRIQIDYAFESGANFLTSAARDAARLRVENHEPKQTLDVDRLYADLLSSMPMCFNLFGPVSVNTRLATDAVKGWWPDAPGKVETVRFEWSPGRQLRGRFLENRSAFDVAFELKLPDGTAGIIGVETKYHEHSKREKLPSNMRLQRYQQVTRGSGIFLPGAFDHIIGTKLQQIWLDHLLALSMLQDAHQKWTWVKFVLVHPTENKNFAQVAKDYTALLNDSSTFEVRTIESLLDNSAIPAEAANNFQRRYLW